jgi:folate-binding protein YgfZ
MRPLLLHEFHAARGGSFFELNGAEAVQSCGAFDAEYQALTQKAALLDLSFRGRVCLLGSDREKFLHGQITNDVLRLKTGQGCYAALVTAKGKIESDLFVFKLREELLLDFEPGLTERVVNRLQRYVIAEDVQVVDVSPHYGLLSVCGPESIRVLEQAALPVPETSLSWSSTATTAGELYVMNNTRFRLPAFDLFVPAGEIERIALALEKAGQEIGARWAGFEALETVRIENAIPRYGVDMNETTLPQEAELQDRAISFAKGCYIGQEVIARIRTYGQVAKALRLLRLSHAASLPTPGTKLFSAGKEVGSIMSVTRSPKFAANVALGYVRKETNALGTVLQAGAADGPGVEIVPAG